MRFFYPKPNFLPFIKTYAELHSLKGVIDVGCGNGHIVKLLNEAHVVAVGVDPFYDMFDKNNAYQIGEGSIPILPNYGEKCLLVKKVDYLKIFCRPCHGGFVSKVMNVLLENDIALYIGLEKNLEDDLDSEDIKYDLLLKDVGEEHENIYRITKQ